MTRRMLACVVAAIGLTTATAADAAITPVTPDTAGATTFGQAIFAKPANVLAGGNFQTFPGPGTAATADALTVFPTSGGSFGILSTGRADSADDPNSGITSGTYSETPVRGTSDKDVTVVRIPFTVAQSANCLTMDFQFLSEEYPNFVGSEYNDAFIAELDTTSWTTSGVSTISAPNNFAFDQNGNVVSVNAVGIGGFSTQAAAGTTYGGATKLLRASKLVSPGTHNLYLSIFDQGDSVYDSAAFIDNVRVGFVSNPAQNCKPGAQVANYTLDLQPASATHYTGTSHTATATLTDDNGQPVVGAPVTFTVSGANPGTSTATTDSAGKAAFTYTGTNVGDDAISATYDADNNGSAEAADSATVTWEKPPNEPPSCANAAPSVAMLKQNSHKFNPIRISGLTDPDGDAVSVTITKVEQDEVVNGDGDGNTSPDARRTSRSDTVEVRAERAGPGDGRVYVISFTGDDGKGGACDGSVKVVVPHDQSGRPAVDSGSRYDSFGS